MSEILVADAHAIVWFLEGNPRLGTLARQVLLDPSSHIALPAIALAEACWVVDLGRTTIPSSAELLRSIDCDLRIEVVPLDRQIVERSTTISGIAEMHDRQIVATALQLAERGERVALLTADANITAARVLPVIW